VENSLPEKIPSRMTGLSEPKQGKIRSGWTVYFLGLITFGIYWIYWYYKIIKEISDHIRLEYEPFEYVLIFSLSIGLRVISETTFGISKAFVIPYILSIILNIYAMRFLLQQMQELYRQDNLPSKFRKILGYPIAGQLIPLGWMFLLFDIQEELNLHWKLHTFVPEARETYIEDKRKSTGKTKYTIAGGSIILLILVIVAIAWVFWSMHKEIKVDELIRLVNLTRPTNLLQMFA